jgi:hypothetical protein
MGYGSKLVPGACRVLSWPSKRRAGLGEFFPREAELGAKEDLGRLAPGQGHEADAFLEVAVAGQEFESRLDESFGIQGNEIGLVTVDALVVSGVERADSLSGFERAVIFQKIRRRSLPFAP